MTPKNCPLVLECPAVGIILERYTATQAIKKVNSICAKCGTQSPIVMERSK